MANVWVTTVKTSLPDACYYDTDLKEADAYASFEEARTDFFEKIRKYAYEDNAMFDGNGNIKELEAYIYGTFPPEDDEYKEYRDGLIDAKDLLKDLISGVHVECNNEISYYDWMVEAAVEDDTLRIRGCGDGPINGVDPMIRTNIFDVNDENKHYFLYIDDMLGQGVSAEFYIDLFKPSFRHHTKTK